MKDKAMRFDTPHFLFLIPAAALVLALLHLWVLGRKRRRLARFGEQETVRKLTRGVSLARQNWRFLLLLAAVSLIVFSLARPQYGTIEQPLRRRGVEVVIAIDCSQSMLGQDIKPNRFERARSQLKGLIQRLEGDSVGIVAFAGIPVVQCPMTSDYDMALNLLDSLDVDTVPVQGTAIGLAVKKATEMYKAAGKGNRVLVLLTDGEEHEGDPVKAAEEAAREGVRIYAIGIGSTEGVPIPLPEGGYKEAEGGKVNTRLNFETLTRMALATGGKAILANPSGDVELKEILRDVKTLKETDLQAKAFTIHKERFQYSLLPAVILLAAEMLLSDRRRRIESGGAGRFD